MVGRYILSKCLFFNFNAMDDFVGALAKKYDVSKELLAELAREYCISGYEDRLIKKELESFVNKHEEDTRK